MNEKEFDRLLDEALRIPLPTGLAEKLEKQIDQYAASKRRALRGLFLSGAVAAILLAVLFIGTESRLHKPADTFTDPAEAAAVAEQALTLLSVQLNKGLDQVATAGQKLDQANQTIEKYFK
jgi:hypothetical protein